MHRLEGWATAGWPCATDPLFAPLSGNGPVHTSVVPCPADGLAAVLVSTPFPLLQSLAAYANLARGRENPEWMTVHPGISLSHAQEHGTAYRTAVHRHYGVASTTCHRHSHVAAPCRPTLPMRFAVQAPNLERQHVRAIRKDGPFFHRRPSCAMPLTIRVVPHSGNHPAVLPVCAPPCEAFPFVRECEGMKSRIPVHVSCHSSSHAQQHGTTDSTAVCAWCAGR